MLEKLEFNITINATKEKIWKVLWSPDSYKAWTNAFCEGSYMITDWKVGDKVHFLAPDGAGMYSIIEEKTENEYVAFKHIGEIKDKKELALDAESKIWTGSMETYLLTEKEDGIELHVEMDTLDDYIDFFCNHFPDGLKKIKELAEK